MEDITNYDKNSEKITGFVFLILFAVMLCSELTRLYIKTDINGIHDSLKLIGNSSKIFLTHAVFQLIAMVLFIILSASLYLLLRPSHNILSHFIAFGLAASGLTLIVTSSGSFSLLNIAHEYILSSGVESDIIAINGLVISELRKNALLIAYTIEGLSLIVFGFLIVRSKYIHIIAGISVIVFSLVYIFISWANYGQTYFIIIKYVVIANYLILGGLILKKGYTLEDKQ